MKKINDLGYKILFVIIFIFTYIIGIFFYPIYYLIIALKHLHPNNILGITIEVKDRILIIINNL